MGATKKLVLKFKKNVIYKLNIDFWSNKNYQLGIPDNKCFKDKKLQLLEMPFSLILMTMMISCL